MDQSKKIVTMASLFRMAILPTKITHSKMVHASIQMCTAMCPKERINAAPTSAFVLAAYAALWRSWVPGGP